MIYAIIQARMGSSRLPGKVMLDLKGEPDLFRVVQRVRCSKKIDKVIVATTESPSDNDIAEFCKNREIPCFKGSEADVLERYYKAAVAFKAGPGDSIIRITADCPFIDPEVIDEVIALHLKSGADYTSNVNPPTFPDGLDVEIFKFEVLRKAWEDALLLSDREHVTLYIRNHPETFVQENLRNPVDLSSHRWTLDEKEDYLFIYRIYTELFVENRFFLMKDILEHIERNPEIESLNARFERNEGLARSLQNDKIMTNQ